MEIPKERRKPKSLSPNIILIFAQPKQGKTSIVSQLEDSLILELETGGADFVEGRVLEIKSPPQFEEALITLETSPTKVCKYLILDTTTKLDEWSEIVGTYHYMEKAQGKKFNRRADGTKITHKDADFETVHELGQGFGYQHSRNVMIDWYDRLLNLINLGKVDRVILLSHVKDKLIETKAGNTVEIMDINLTGKVKNIYASRVDAVAYLSRKGDQAFLNFSNEHKVVAGGRCPHLDGEILISEKQPDKTIKTFWENIYLD